MTIVLLDYRIFVSEYTFEHHIGEATTLRESISCLFQRWKLNLNYLNFPEWPLLGLFKFRQGNNPVSLIGLSILRETGMTPSFDNLCVLL